MRADGASQAMGGSQTGLARARAVCAGWRGNRGGKQTVPRRIRARALQHGERRSERWNTPGQTEALLPHHHDRPGTGEAPHLRGRDGGLSEVAAAARQRRRSDEGSRCRVCGQAGSRETGRCREPRGWDT